MSTKQRSNHRYSVGLNIAVALAYLVAARLAILLAIAPGYSSAIWPAAGIALAAVLLYGNRLWVGVWMGSFLANVANSADLSFLNTDIRSLVLMIGIPTGAALQAVGMAALIRRLVGFPVPLIREGNILLFLLIGGPVGCMVSATIGVSSLVAGGVLTAADIPYHWFTWWAGDTIGVLIFVPLIFVELADPRGIWRARRISVSVPLCISFVLAIVAYVYTSGREQDRIQNEFERRTLVIAQQLQRNLETRIEVLHSVHSFFDSSERVTRDEFDSFASRPHSRHGDIQAIEWVPVVADEQRDEFVETVRHNGFPEFDILELGPAGSLQPAARRPETYPVHFVYPYQENRVAHGFDLGSHPIRLETLRRAQASGEAVVSGRVRLVQDQREMSGILAILAIYGEHGEASQYHRDHRRYSLDGFILGAFHVSDLVSDPLRKLNEPNIELQIFDESANASDQLLVTFRGSESISQPPSEPADKRFRLTSTNQVQMADRTWRIVFASTPAYRSGLSTPNMWYVLAGGMLFTGLLGTVLLVITGHTAATEQIVSERTEALSRSNMELEESRQVAELANQAKSQFLAGVSHELRTPLNAIIGFSEILSDEAQDQGHEILLDDVEKIHKSAQHLLGLINDILDVSKVESGHTTVRLQSFDVGELATDVADTMRPLIEKNGNRLRVQLSAPLGSMTSDRTLVQQILLNLLGNAAKFCQQGTVTLRASRTATRPGQDSFVFAVQDEGIGLSADQLDHIFEPFTQADASTTRKYGGTGLGLSLCRKFCRLLGGEISVESTEGVGSTFTVVLPAKTRYSKLADRGSQWTTSTDLPPDASG